MVIFFFILLHLLFSSSSFSSPILFHLFIPFHSHFATLAFILTVYQFIWAHIFPALCLSSRQLGCGVVLSQKSNSILYHRMLRMIAAREKKDADKEVTDSSYSVSSYFCSSLHFFLPFNSTSNAKAIEYLGWNKSLELPNWTWLLMWRKKRNIHHLAVNIRDKNHSSSSSSVEA